jgi:hypothetical protein
MQQQQHWRRSGKKERGDQELKQDETQFTTKNGAFAYSMPVQTGLLIHLTIVT